MLLISADLDELIGLSDTLRVIYDGKLVADADPATITPEALGSAMTGAASGHLEDEESPGTPADATGSATSAAPPASPASPESPEARAR
ncbi:ABC transporter ATP-binding protein OS=Streptomyces tendae OX=1932 GN=GUR47_16340 PE=4 SV=1 [Streptomyces tendae]